MLLVHFDAALDVRNHRTQGDRTSLIVWFLTFFLWVTLSSSAVGEPHWNTVIHQWGWNKESAETTLVVLIMRRKEVLMTVGSLFPASQTSWSQMKRREYQQPGSDWTHKAARQTRNERWNFHHHHLAHRTSKNSWKLSWKSILAAFNIFPPARVDICSFVKFTSWLHTTRFILTSSSFKLPLPTHPCDVIKHGCSRAHLK